MPQLCNVSSSSSYNYVFGGFMSLSDSINRYQLNMVYDVFKPRYR